MQAKMGLTQLSCMSKHGNEATYKLLLCVSSHHVAREFQAPVGMYLGTTCIRLCRTWSEIFVLFRNDWWLPTGIAGFITGLFCKKSFGSTDYQHWVAQVRGEGGRGGEGRGGKSRMIYMYVHVIVVVRQTLSLLLPSSPLPTLSSRPSPPLPSCLPSPPSGAEQGV